LASTDGSRRAPTAPPARTPELRLHGLNACLAAFAARPDALRKVYLSEARLVVLREVLAHCVRQRLGYRVVAEEDLQRLAGSSHHEGVVFDMRPPPVPTITELISRTGSQQASLLLWLDGVGNPHNLGAVLRSAAHFGIGAVLLPPGSGLGLSGAACRVAEGGAEALPVIRLADAGAALQQLRRAGYSLAATVPRGGTGLFDARLPARLVMVFGAEASGIGSGLLSACTLRLGIPGTGAVESLNISSAAAVCMAEWRRQRGTD
jgi:TrmH RNA methyltransferase